MDREIPRPGEKYLYFKNKLYQILCIAEHTETDEKMVVYQALYGTFACFARPLEIFMGEVDREKYPEVNQKYRFERVNDTELPKEGKEAEDIQNTEPMQQASQLDADITQNRQDYTDTLQETPENQEEEQADPALLRFLDADTLEEKYQILKSMERSITHRLIDDFSAVLDLVIPEGSLDFRYHQLLSSIGTMQRYENTRLR